MSVPIFTRTDEGVAITTPWPSETPATRNFIESADPRWLQRKWRTLHFTLINGSATYRIASRVRDDRSLHYLLKRVG